MTNDETWSTRKTMDASSFGPSCFFRHLCFDIRHCCLLGSAEKVGHHLVTFIEGDRRGGGRDFVVGLRRVGLDAGAADRQRHDAVAVRLGAERRRMIGRNEDAVVALRSSSIRPAAADDLRSISSKALILASTRPSCDASSVASTWTQIMSVVEQGVDGVASLGGVVGIEVAGRAGHFDALPTDQRARPRSRSTAVIILPVLPCSSANGLQARRAA